MARIRDVRQFDPGTFRATVRQMQQLGEDVHATGRKYRDETGQLHPNVDIQNKAPRGSHNAMIPGEEPGIYSLTHGISLPVLSMFDGTGSTAQWVGEFFAASERQHRLLDGVRTRYNPQLASGVVQDVYNVEANGLPVVQVSQFESDERSAEQVRLLQPASMGNDTSAEDYDLGVYYATLIYADIWQFYGLKGYMTLALDEIGRGSVTAEGIRRYLGQSYDGKGPQTKDICQQLLDHWHLFILQVPTYNGELLRGTYAWWAERLEESRIIQVPDPRLLAEVHAALIYVAEATNPSKQGLTEFLRRGGEQSMIDAADLEMVWRWIQPAEEHFGAQAQLPGYQDIPRLGDVFRHFRHAWPIGHPRENENVTPEETATPPPSRRRSSKKGG